MFSLLWQVVWHLKLEPFLLRCGNASVTLVDPSKITTRPKKMFSVFWRLSFSIEQGLGTAFAKDWKALKVV
jgi:hypothetical protein